MKSDGLKVVFIERIAEPDMAEYRELAEMLKNWKEPTGNDPTDEFMRQLNREDRLMLGAVSRVDGLGQDSVKTRQSGTGLSPENRSSYSEIL